MADKKTDALREKLAFKPKNVFFSEHDLSLSDSFSEEYKEFITKGKTGRLCVKEAVAIAESAGFVPYSRGMQLTSGDKIYKICHGKAIVFAVIGKKSLSAGINITAAHIDVPCLDLKQMPLYESEGLALFKTHYYGGIKKYQWPAIPLALYGVVIKKNGEVCDVAIGDEPTDPVFTITDLLPHLAKDQMAKKAGEFFTGEDLNILCGSRPVPGADEKEKDAVKLNVLRLLNEKYGIIEEDFLSAELTVVPAFAPRDIGFDRSLIGAYGHDDRVCSYPSLRAICDIETPDKTAVCMLADKEEIGSEGISGMQSSFFDTFIEDICDSAKVSLRECFENSACLSADVAAAVDPNYPEVHEKQNAAYLNRGIALCKFTGSRGKYDSNDATAEMIAKLRNLFDSANVFWQMCELGKVDQGGGGTVAMYMSKRNIETIDAGVPVLGMHSPFEVIAKNDVYMAYLAMSEFYKNY